MTSAINALTIDTNYPIAGQDNDTQGFRNNFKIIQTGLITAASEITSIQSNVSALQTAVGGIAGTTGTGDLVLATGPSLVAPNVGAATGLSLSVTGNITVSNVNVSGNIASSGNITLDNRNALRWKIGTYSSSMPIIHSYDNKTYIDSYSNVYIRSGNSSPVVTEFMQLGIYGATLSVNTSSTAFRITQTGSGNALVIEDTTSIDSTPFIIDTNGKAGVGLIPTYQLDVESTVNVAARFGKASAQKIFMYSDTNDAYITSDASALNAIRFTPGSNIISLLVNNTEQLRVDSTGLLSETQPTPTSKTTTVSLTPSEIRTKIIVATHSAGATQTYTLPTGTDMDIGTNLNSGNGAFDWSIINTSTGVNTITLAANTGHTIIGNTIVNSGASAWWRSRQTADNTFITYRIA